MCSYLFCGLITAFFPQLSADMILNRFLCMDRRDSSHGCRKCWTTPLLPACPPRRRNDITEHLSTLYTRLKPLPTDFH